MCEHTSPVPRCFVRSRYAQLNSLSSAVMGNHRDRVSPLGSWSMDRSASFRGQTSAVRFHRAPLARCRIQKCRRPPSVSLGGLQRRSVKRAELPPIFHLQGRFRAHAAIASKNGMGVGRPWRLLIPPEITRQPFRRSGLPIGLLCLEG